MEKMRNHEKNVFNIIRLRLLSVILLISMLSPLFVYAAASTGNVFYLLANGTSLTVRLADTAAARELDALLAKEDITIDMTGNSFEQYGALGRRLASDDAQITAQPGDVLLYKGDTVCVFYGTNRYAYTRLGTVANADAEQLAALLSGDDLTVTLSKLPGTGSVAPDGGDDTVSSDLMARLKALLEKLLQLFRRLSVFFARPNA